MEEVLKVLPIAIVDKLKGLELADITEIRIRIGKSVIIYRGLKEEILDYIACKQDILSVLKNVSLNSIYSVQNDINKGYITITGGHRIGIAGEIVVDGDKIKNIKEVSSLNIRIAREFKGIADNVIDKIVSNGRVKNTIILSLPGAGKTTLLRDIVRSLSNLGKTVSVVDERGEIASMSGGFSSLDVGLRTDVLSYGDKSRAMQMAVRSLNPNVICTDEIGDEKDAQAIKYICRSGVSYIATMHGDSIDDLKISEMKEILNIGYIDLVILLSKDKKIGNIEKIYTKEELKC